MNIPEVQFRVGDCYDFYEFLTAFPYVSNAESSGPQLFVNVGISEETLRSEILILIEGYTSYWRFEPVNFTIKLPYLYIVQNDTFEPIMMYSEEIERYAVTMDAKGHIVPEESRLEIPITRRDGPKMILTPAKNEDNICTRIIFPMVCLGKEKVGEK